MTLYQKCVHLGCRVPFCQSSQWFECPCHGSKYNKAGEYRFGPAPTGLNRFKIRSTPRTSSPARPAGWTRSTRRRRGRCASDAGALPSDGTHPRAYLIDFGPSHPTGGGVDAEGFLRAEGIPCVS